MGRTSQTYLICLPKFEIGTELKGYTDKHVRRQMGHLLNEEDPPIVPLQHAISIFLEMIYLELNPFSCVLDEIKIMFTNKVKELVKCS